MALGDLYSIKGLTGDDYALIVDWSIRNASLLAVASNTVEANEQSMSDAEKYEFLKTFVVRVLDAMPAVMVETAIAAANEFVDYGSAMAKFKEELDNL